MGNLILTMDKIVLVDCTFTSCPNCPGSCPLPDMQESLAVQFSGAGDLHSIPTLIIARNMAAIEDLDGIKDLALQWLDNISLMPTNLTPFSKMNAGNLVGTTYGDYPLYFSYVLTRCPPKKWIETIYDRGDIEYHRGPNIQIELDIPHPFTAPCTKTPFEVFGEQIRAILSGGTPSACQV